MIVKGVRYGQLQHREGKKTISHYTRLCDSNNDNLSNISWNKWRWNP